jgi:hypothetical protein
MLRTELLPAFEMSDAKVDGFLADIRRRARACCSATRRR